MQIYSREEKGLITASKAEKKKDYTCPECGSPVRVKGGQQRQSHFFHLKKSRCRLSSRGPEHLRIQKFLQYLFEEEAIMEHAFPEIDRIADVACLSSKKIYEIQCSPMPLEEAEERCRDYESMGFSIIWILHEMSFNDEEWMTPSERFLRTKTCYYTDMDAEGNGAIYDQLDVAHGRCREFYDGRRQVNLRNGRRVPKRRWPQGLQSRAGWSYTHEGDYIDLELTKGLPLYVDPPTPWIEIKDFYKGFINYFLEKTTH